MTDTTAKAKRRLSNFDFSQEGSHLALVHKEQGGAANGYSTLIMKATGKYTPEFIQKVAHVQVTLTFEEFLAKFFDMWYTDAKVLATMLGMQDEDEEEGDWYKNHVAEQVDKFEILKSGHESENKLDFLASLGETDYLAVLKNQESFEKALLTYKAHAAVHNEETPMPDSAKPELIAKAQYDEVQKAFDDQKVELQKATEVIEKYKQAEKAQVAKARQDTLLGAIEAPAEAEKLFKAVGELSDEGFQAVVEVVKALNAKVDDNDLFVEKGSPTEGEQVQKSALRAQLENKYNK